MVNPEGILLIVSFLSLIRLPALDIARWDLECEFNNTDHRTELNGVEQLIVRRGQPFTINLHLRSGEYQPGGSALNLTVETGNCVFTGLLADINSV